MYVTPYTPIDKIKKEIERLENEAHHTANPDDLNAIFQDLDYLYSFLPEES